MPRETASALKLQVIVAYLIHNCLTRHHHAHMHRHMYVTNISAHASFEKVTTASNAAQVTHLFSMIAKRTHEHRRLPQMNTSEYAQNVNSAMFLTVRTMRTYLIRVACRAQMIRTPGIFSRIHNNRNETNSAIHKVSTYLIIATFTKVIHVSRARYDSTTTRAYHISYPLLRIRGRRGSRSSRRLSLGLLGFLLLISLRSGSGSGASDSGSRFFHFIGRHRTYCDIVELL